MINIAIIEDEVPAQQQLLNFLKEMRDVHVSAVLSSVTESIRYFSTYPAIDLVLSDVQLSDGLSFDIFRNTGLNVPVIFITGFDKFILHAFESNGIDYILKPTGKEELE